MVVVNLGVSRRQTYPTSDTSAQTRSGQEQLMHMIIRLVLAVVDDEFQRKEGVEVGEALTGILTVICMHTNSRKE